MWTKETTCNSCDKDFSYEYEDLKSYETIYEGGFDAVNSPSHYNDYPVEVIEIIKRTLTKEQFIGYCLGNEIKYRMRAGLKSDNIEEDIKKALKYRGFRRSV